MQQLINSKFVFFFLSKFEIDIFVLHICTKHGSAVYFTNRNGNGVICIYCILGICPYIFKLCSAVNICFYLI